MLRLIKVELNKIKYTYLISVIIGVIYGLLSVNFVLSGYHYNYNIEIWVQSGETFSLLYPLFATLPICWLMFYERKDSFIIYSLLRTSKKKYLLTKWLITSFGGGLIVFLVSITSLFFSLFIVPEKLPTVNDYALKNFAGHYFVNFPLQYGLVLSLWKGIIGFLIATFGFVLSLIVNNLLVILTGPFIYAILENFTLSILNVPYFRLVTSFDLNTLTASAISVDRLIVGPLILCLLIMFLILVMVIPKNETVFKT